MLKIFLDFWDSNIKKFTTVTHEERKKFETCFYLNKKKSEKFLLNIFYQFLLNKAQSQRMLLQH